MSTRSDPRSLLRWRRNPVAFIERHLVNPETGKLFKLLEAEKQFLRLALTLGPDGRLLYPELVFGAIKKSGKSAFAALVVLIVLLLFGGPYAEAYCVANDYQQAQDRVFAVCCRIVEASPLLRGEARIGADKITFPATGATITALASDYAGIAGGHPVISVFDELWAYTSERARRMYDELVPVPTRKISCRLVVSHAGFEDAFIAMDDWDACVDPGVAPVLQEKALRVHVGVDASVKHDTTAIVAVTFDREDQHVRMVNHRIFQPSKREPLDFEATIEATLCEFMQRYAVCSVHYDPFQMAAVAQRLQAAGVPMHEFPQTADRLTAIGSGLLELVKSRSLVVYPDADIRLAISRAVAVETPRGWRIAKDKASHKIDVVVALAMAAHAAVQGSRVPPEPPIVEIFVGEVQNPVREAFTPEW